jgi:hypothetical protein
MKSNTIRVNSKITFPNPYVIRIEYEAVMYSNSSSLSDYSAILRKVYRLIEETWGYTTLEPERIANNQITDNQITPSLLNLRDSYLVFRGYICFKDEADALQFMLSIPTKAIRVRIWPSTRLFTIHEIVET